VHAFGALHEFAGGGAGTVDGAAVVLMVGSRPDKVAGCLVSDATQLLIGSARMDGV